MSDFYRQALLRICTQNQEMSDKNMNLPRAITSTIDNILWQIEHISLKPSRCQHKHGIREERQFPCHSYAIKQL